MSEAWDAGQKPYMLIGIPNTDIVTMHWSLEFAAMWKPNGCLLRGWSGMPIDVARNTFVKNAREMQVKYLLFMDSDVLPQRSDWIRLLLDTRQPIISGLYWSKKNHPSMWIKNPNDPPDKQTYSPVLEWQSGSIIGVDAVPAGALLIDMRVFDEIDKALGVQPYFVWNWPDPENIKPGEKSEDFWFCDLAQRAGFNILVHTGVELCHEQTIAWDIKGQVARIQS